jgi:hypothetical protein
VNIFDRELPQDSSSGDAVGSAEGTLDQLIREADVLRASTGVDTDIANRRNELLWKITAEIDDAKLALERLEDTKERLKKHLKQLKSLLKVLGG